MVFEFDLVIKKTWASMIWWFVLCTLHVLRKGGLGGIGLSRCFTGNINLAAAGVWGRGGCGVVTTGREKEKADLYSISVLIGVVWLRAYIHNCITYKPFLLWYVLVIPPLSFLGTYFFF